MDTQFDGHGALPSEDTDADERGLVRLYVAGHGARTEEAWQTVRMACQDIRATRLDVELVDVSERPEAASKAGIVFTPTLVRVRPGPERRWIGEFVNTDAVIRALVGDDA